MPNLLTGIHWKLVALALAAMLLAACGGNRTKSAVVQAGNIPSSFDVTILADKDGQFDYDGAPLTPEDLKGAFRYRQEESLPMATVLLKRGEKQRIKKEHEAALARLAHQMRFTAFVEESDGQISELQANIKDADSDSAK